MIKVITISPCDASRVQLQMHSFGLQDLHKALDVIKQVNKGHDGRQRKVLYSTGVGCLVFKEKIENYVNARCVCH